MLFYGTVFRSFEQYFLLHQLGTLASDEWEGWRLPLGQVLNEPGVKQARRLIRGQHSRDFTELVDRLAQTPSGSPTRGLIFEPPRTG